MRLHEEFKLYETMWDDSVEQNTADENISYDALKNQLIDYYLEKGFDKDAEVLKGYSIVPQTNQLRNTSVANIGVNPKYIYIQPELAEPDNFTLTAAVIRFELAFIILNISTIDAKLGRATEQTIKSALKAVRARLTNEELTILSDFKLGGRSWGLSESTNISMLKESSTSIDAKKLYDEVYNTVESCLQRIGLRVFCEDSYDNSYDNGEAMYYELQWNFSKVRNATKAESAINTDLSKLGVQYGIDISGGFDADVLADEGLINLVVAYELPYDCVA